MIDNPKRRRHWFRAILLLMLVVGVGIAWFVVKRQGVARQRSAVDAILKAGGSVKYDYQSVQGAEPPGPLWLRKLVGNDFFTSVVSVNLSESQITDAQLECLESLPTLQELDLYGTKTSDVGLGHVGGLVHLERLGVDGTQITDSGLEQLSGLPQLGNLDLSGTKVTDAGLKYLKILPNLEVLRLAATKISDAGLDHISGLPHLRELNLNGTQITDAGLGHLEQCNHLHILWLIDTKVTDDGLKHLASLSELDNLYLRGVTRVPLMLARWSIRT